MNDPTGGKNRADKSLTAENADLKKRLALAEQALMAEREQQTRGSTSNPFGFSQQLRDDLAGVIELLPAFVGLVSTQGRLIFVNASGCTMLGVEPAAVVQLHVRDLTPAAVGEQWMGEAFPAAQTRGLWTADSCLRHREGREIPVTATVIAHRGSTGAVRYYSIIARDISERQMAITLQREQAALLESVHEAIVEVDLDGRILLWNHGAEAIYGWASKEVAGRFISDLTHKDELGFHAMRQTTLETGKWDGEVMSVTRDGKQLLVESRWSLLRDERGQARSFIIISTDITEKKRLAMQFLRAQRMESIGTLAGGIAHDLNNVLAPILMGIAVLRQRITDEMSLRLLDTFEVSASRGAAMVRQVLAFSRGIEGQRIPIAPIHLLREGENLLGETLPKAIQLEVRGSRDDWPVLGDLTQLHQVLLNLCVNARDAMPHGGRLLIDTENVLIDDAYRLMHPEARVGPHVLIRVSDTGTGIPAAIRDKIFEPFFTTKEVGKGTGLGLSTAHTIVKSHGGFIHLYSEEGKGTTFKLYLPAEPAGQIQVQPITEQRFPRGQGELVLVVDDEEIIRETAKTVLERANYRVLTARDGAEGVALYVQNMESVAAVLTDITMPVMDGIATMRAIKSIHPAARIICASGLASNRQLATLTGAGMSHFIAKPFTAESLLQTLHKALDRADAASEPNADAGKR